MDERNGLISLCPMVQTQDLDNCEHGVGGGRVEDCKARAEAEYAKCSSRAGSHLDSDAFLLIGFYALCGLVSAYLTA